MAGGWSILEAELPQRDEPFELRAYSEFMPPFHLGVKPYGEPDPLPKIPGDEYGLTIAEVDEHRLLAPALEKIAAHIVRELIELANRVPTMMSKTLLKNNPAWPAELAARPRALLEDPHVLMLPVALSQTQDDKGLARWTLFGASHQGAERAFWLSFFETPNVERKDAEERFREFLAFAAPHAKEVRIRTQTPEDLPSFARDRTIETNIEDADALITFEPFAELPAAIREKYLAGALQLLPVPSSLIFHHHTGYQKLGRELPRAQQIALLHLFPRSETRFGLRIPQSGWLDEKPDPEHRVVPRVRRTHRWQKLEREDDDAQQSTFDDPVTVALFSSDPDDVGLYGKPMARNAQIWTEDYRALLDGPNATPSALDAAADAMEEGDRFGYRFLFPAMELGPRTIFWHRPVFAKIAPSGAIEIFTGELRGYFTAERTGYEPLHFWPRVLDRPEQLAALKLKKRNSENARKIFEWRDLLERPLPPSFARRLVFAPRDVGFEGWLSSLLREEKEAWAAAETTAAIKNAIGPELEAVLADAKTFAQTHARAFEENYWKMIAHLAEGRYREKNNADFVLANEGRSGGAHAQATGRNIEHAHHLDALGNYLHEYYAERIAAHEMEGRAYSADHRVAWRTDFDFSWSEAWRRNQEHPEGAERNIVVVIPGRNRGEAVIMGDHYDTAYMEDVYDPERGGDKLRAAAAGADDNHSATAALMLAADVLLPLSREGLLERDVWLVHLTGEEFPCDCLGARALAEDLVEKKLHLHQNNGAAIDLSRVRIRGAFIMDMIAHNNDKKRDVFQIAPGEGRGAARLAWHAYLANRRWNRGVRTWNRAPERADRGRSERMKDGSEVPPIAEHLSLTGELRPEWDPKSSLYNTDAQIFSDAGIPVVLLMEHYDIGRAGYHDLHDTMENIDLDYGAALAAIAIESVASVACAENI